MKCFTLPGRVESLNKLLTSHWSKRYASNNAWFAKVIAIAGARYERPKVRQDVTLTVYLNRELDRDNLIGGCKGLIDSLTKAGYLKDDKPEWCVVTYNSEPCKKGQERVEVKIRDESESE